MGFVGDLVKGVLGGGQTGGSNFKAQSAPLIQPTTLGQVGQGYDQSQSGIAQQQAFLNALNAQNGLGNQSNVFNQQQGLANQFQGVANGTGPNPALQQLQNTTGQNVANQAALMAGQRGSGANAGLLARQAAQQGGALQQQAVGQGAALQAQQQLAAMNALQGQQGMMGNLAGQQVQQQAGGLQNLNQFGQSEQNQLLNSLGNFNQANVSNTGSQNSANAGIAGQNAHTQGGLLGGALGALGTAVAGPLGGLAGSALGGIGNMFGSGGTPSGGQYQSSNSGYTPNIHFAHGGPVSNAGKHLKGMPMMAHGAMLNATAGAKVPGKASVRGDSLKNDTVPAMLSAGEVVIPLSVMQSKDPVKNSAKFVQATIKKGKKG